MVDLVMVSAALGAPARSWRSLDEEKSSSFSPFSTRTAQVLLEQRAPFGKRFEGSREGILKGMGRFVCICELRVVAGRGGENFFFFYRFPWLQLRCRRSSALRAASGHGAPGLVLARVWAALEGSARSWRSLDEEKRRFSPLL